MKNNERELDASVLEKTMSANCVMIKSQHKTIYETIGRSPIHPFPARMAPGIAFDALGKCNRKRRVLDPMMGSGTVLAVARSLGHRAIGMDTDPLSVLLSKVWTTAIQPELIRIKAEEVLKRARNEFDDLSSREAYPDDADDETKCFLRYWFDEYARRQLTALSRVIQRVRDGDVRDVLWCALSRLIITKQSGASLAMDLSHSRPHRSFDRAPTKPFRKFLVAVGTVVENCPHKGDVRLGPPTVTLHGDARRLPLDDDSIDLVVTSPPYLNAIDYMRCSKFSLVWMGYTIESLRHIRSTSIGTEVSLQKEETDECVRTIVSDLNLRPKLDDRGHALLCRYVHDMQQAVAEVARILLPGGRAVYVVGNSTVRGTFIRNSAVVQAVAENNGLKLAEKTMRLLPPNRRYLPPPSSHRAGTTLSARMRQEVVLAFDRPTTRVNC